MNYQAAFNDLVVNLPKFGTGIGLRRVELLMRIMVPREFMKRTHRIVVTGTDGKGSTAILAERIFRNCGVNCGLFTSPHFLDFTERFVIAGKPVDYPQLFEVTEQVMAVKAKIETHLNEQFGFFEVFFVIALVLFARNQVEMMIFEAGIGGRFDPVRLLKARLTALTSVSLEHTELLGDNEELIAFDKIDACAHGGTIIVGHLQPRLVRKGLMKKIRSYAAVNDRHVISSEALIYVISDLMCVADMLPMRISPRMIGLPQQQNIRTAVALVYQHWARFGFEPPRFAENCKLALAECQIPGRFEKITDEPEIYVDAAHTNDAYKKLFKTIEKQFDDKPRIFIAGISKGRDNTLLGTLLTKLGCEIIVTQSATRGANAEDLFVQCHTDKPMYLEAQVASALALAKQRAAALGARIFVVGSLFLAAEVTALEKGLPAPCFHSD